MGKTNQEMKERQEILGARERREGSLKGVLENMEKDKEVISQFSWF